MNIMMTTFHPLDKVLDHRAGILQFICFIFCSGTLLAQPVEVQWAAALQGAGSQYSRGPAIGADGSVYWIGAFSGTMDLNSGPATQLESSAGSNDIYLIKHDPSGAFVWGHRYGSGQPDDGNIVHVLPDGNVLLVGQFHLTVDFDPGIGSVQHTSAGGSDLVLSKLTPGGDLIWTKRYGGTGDEEPYDVDVDSDGNIIVAGQFFGSTILDPAGVQGQHTSNGTGDGFVLKLDGNGDHLWSFSVGGIGYERCWSVTIGNEGRIFVAGTNESAFDADPGPGEMLFTPGGVYGGFLIVVDQDGSVLNAHEFDTTNSDGQTETKAVRTNSVGEVFVVGRTYINSVMPDGSILAPAGAQDAFLAKFSPEGAFLWAIPFASTFVVELHLEIDGSDRLYIYGSFSGMFDLDPGPVTEFSPSVGATDLFLIKLTSEGSFINGFTMGSGSGDSCGGLAVTDVGNVVLSGDHSNTIDLQPGPAELLFNTTGGQDAFLALYDPVACADLQYHITNLDPVLCDMPGNIDGVIGGGTPPYGFEWEDISLPASLNVSILEPGTYPIHIWDSEGCERIRTLIVGGTTAAGQFDLIPVMVGTLLQAGFPSVQMLQVENIGCIPVDGNVDIIFPDGLTFMNSEPSPSSIAGQVVNWDFTALEPGMPFLVAMSVQVSSGLAIGETRCFEIDVLPVLDDAGPENNHLDHCKPIVAAYDPNDKAVHPLGTCPEAYVQLDQTLRYTVRFQNTGNASANEVRIIDTLSTLLDPSSLHLLAQSHDMYAEWLSPGVLQFTFPEIQLPDSTTDPIGSQGYVVFEISPMMDVVDQDVVMNEVGIYFDFNEPVITNTVSNTFITVVPENCGSVEISEPENEQVAFVHPNPNSGTFILRVPNNEGTLDIRVLDMAGRVILQRSALKTGSPIVLPSMPAGIFAIIARTTDGTEYRSRFVVD